MKRDLISIQDLSTEELKELVTQTAFFKKNKDKLTGELKGKAVGLVFQKPSNRTRVSFEIGIWQMGGKCLYLSPREINLGKRESTSDVAKTLSRYLHALVARTYTHQDVVDLAKYASIPVINGLSDLFHPCQALADIFTIQEKFGKMKGITLAYIGDGNNVCHSLLLAGAKAGINIHVASPKNYEPDAKIFQLAQKEAKHSGAQISLTDSPQKAAAKAHVLYADVWVSMGQEEETNKRLEDLKEFQINDTLAHVADKDFIFMHCLPAHRGQEVSAGIIDGKHSVVFDQAENRMHAQKSILLLLLGEHS